MSRWPIDTLAGRVVLVVALLLVFAGGLAIRTEPTQWWGYALVVAAMGLAAGCRALFFRGYFGEQPPDAE